MLDAPRSLTPGARASSTPTVLAGGLEREDAWQRATELLFERLAVSWTISGLEITRQKELLGRYRMATDRRAAVRPRHAARARRRALPGAPGAMTSPIPTRSPRCSATGASSVHRARPGARRTTPLARRRWSARSTARCSSAARGRCSGSRRPELAEDFYRLAPRRPARRLRRRSTWPSASGRRLPADRRAREHAGPGRRRPGRARARRARPLADPGGADGQALVRDAVADAGARPAGGDERRRLRRVRRPAPCSSTAPTRSRPGASCRARQAQLVERLSEAREIRIEADGTDLRLRVEGRTWINSDGRRNMPSGEVFTGPLEDSANGTIRFTIPSSPRGVLGRGRRPHVRARAGRERHAPTAARTTSTPRSPPTPAPASSASSGSAPTPASTAPPARSCSTRRWPAPSTSRSAAPIRRPAGATSRRLHWDLICDLRDGGRLTADGDPIRSLNAAATSRDAACSSFQRDDAPHQDRRHHRTRLA